MGTGGVSRLNMANLARPRYSTVLLPTQIYTNSAQNGMSPRAYVYILVDKPTTVCRSILLYR